MARRRASRTGRMERAGQAYAKIAGAVLIALSLLTGVSLVPPQTAAAPHFLAARLGQGFGAGVAVLPAFCFILGLIFFVRESFRLSPRVVGIVVGYLVALVALHLRYPAGRELLAASGRKGGGYLGALLEIGLRRLLGEPGLWTVTLLAGAASVLLLSGVPAADVLRALLAAFRAAGMAAVAGIRYLAAWTAAAALAALRAIGIAMAEVGRACAAEARTACERLSGAGSSAIDRLRAVIGQAADRLARAKPGRASESSGIGGLSPAPPRGERPALPAGLPALDPLLVSAGAAAALSSARAQAAVAPPPSTRERAPDAAPARPSEPDEVEDQAGAAGVPAADGVTPAELPPPMADALLAPEPAGVGSERSSNRTRRKKPRVQQEALAFPDEAGRSYTLPDLSLLDAFPGGKAKAGKVDPEEVARSLEKTLASFGVEAKVIRWETGPVVTRYELQPAPGVKVQKITSLQSDIALALAASSVRLEAPIPGKSAIGVELPNERPGLVHLREILSTEEFQSSLSPLAVAVGKGIAGTPVVADLVAMPHLLIAGATGAGKSVMINSMIASILFRATPERARFLMIDPKRVELTNYNGIPHLLSPVVTGPREAAAKLRWAIQEMESRYGMFAQDGVRNIQAFNAQHPDRPLAYIVIVIDELADLMMVAPADFEEIICRLAQMTRATGIHLLIATQRPSVDVITGLIKANIPSRIAFSVTSQVDSRTILDHPGAEKLLGRGDMLFAPVGATRPTRVQGAFISDAETERLVQFWRAQGEPAYVESLVQTGGAGAPEEESGSDPLLVDAARLVVRAGYASVSLLQRKMRIGYVRAARVVDQLEEKGIAGPSQGSSPREVLVGLEELERILRAGPSPGPASEDGASNDAE